MRVEFGGREVARSKGGVWLFETGLPTRFYLEKTAVSHTCLWRFFAGGGLGREGRRGARTENGSVSERGWEMDWRLGRQKADERRG